MEIKELNAIYKTLDDRKNDIVSSLRLFGEYDLVIGYYNGNYSKNEAGDYEMDYYPIPVISIKGICDIEINIDSISISTKLTKENAIRFNYAQLDNYSFEVFGVEDYLTDYYAKGDSIRGMIEKIKTSGEKHIGFSFCLTNSLKGGEVLKIVKTISSYGFFY